MVGHWFSHEAIPCLYLGEDGITYIGEYLDRDSDYLNVKLWGKNPQLVFGITPTCTILRQDIYVTARREQIVDMSVRRETV